MVLPNAPNAVRGLFAQVLAPRGITLEVLAYVGAVQTVPALVVESVGCTIVPESAVASSNAGEKLFYASIGLPAI